MITICTMDAQARACKGDCNGCGFSLKEQKKRQQMIADNKFTTRWDGVKMLTIKREER